MTKIGAHLGKEFSLLEIDSDPKFFAKRGANVLLYGKKIGTIGVLHPEVLDNFELKYPVSCLELDFDPVW
jgi:phenylalanyl-tRNA synthetase beta chain